jgi:gliding motility-associated-like protein
MQIFNRWGQMVFEANSFTQQWDGTFEGVKVPQGSYVYKASAIGITGDHANKDGTVTVVY